MKQHRTTLIRAALTNTAALAACALGTRPYYRHLLDQAARTAAQVVIGYTKENGESSTRLIQPEEVRRSKAGDYYVRAWDALRDAARSFRIDRITTLETA